MILSRSLHFIGFSIKQPTVHILCSYPNYHITYVSWEKTGMWKVKKTNPSPQTMLFKYVLSIIFFFFKFIGNLYWTQFMFNMLVSQISTNFAVDERDPAPIHSTFLSDPTKQSTTKTSEVTHHIKPCM